VRLDECLGIINRRIRTVEQEVTRRHQLGLQVRPWQHRVEELVEMRREIAALATPEALRESSAGKRAAPPGVAVERRRQDAGSIVS
jgi:hypothetical protein